MKARIVVVLLVLAAACIDPINFRVRDASGDLVVEAWLYDEAGSSYVRLSRTLPVGANPNFQAVSNASVVVVDESGVLNNFIETQQGVYIPEDPMFKGTVGSLYYLRITTADNLVFESDTEEMQESFDGTSLSAVYAPREFLTPAGNLSFEILVDFLVDVQKPADRNVYYKFDWEGTYNMVSPFQNLWDNCPAAELPDDYEVDFSFDFCYITEQSPQSINILSTEGFTGEVFRDHKLASLDPNKRFLFRYSMQAKQYSLSRRAYNYLKSINDQASNVGGLFDPPPAMIPGNIRVLNDEDAKAFGFFFVSSVNRFRDFFDASIVPVPLTHYETCDCYPAVPACLPGDEPDPVMPYCCDCRLLPNSTTIRPDYWIN